MSPNHVKKRMRNVWHVWLFREGSIFQYSAIGQIVLCINKELIGPQNTDAQEKSRKDAKQNSVCAAMAVIPASAENGAVARGCSRMLF
jgi:hypothetical protein